MQAAQSFLKKYSRRSAETRDGGLRIAVVDDCFDDCFLIKHLLARSGIEINQVDHYLSLDRFMSDCEPSPNVVLLDRFLPDTGLSEPHIREIRAKFDNCGVILHTGHITPSIHATAAHEGAFAVIEKGTLGAKAIGAMVTAAAQVGPSLNLH